MVQSDGKHRNKRTPSSSRPAVQPSSHQDVTMHVVVQTMHSAAGTCCWGPPLEAHSSFSAALQQLRAARGANTTDDFRHRTETDDNLAPRCTSAPLKSPHPARRVVKDSVSHTQGEIDGYFTFLQQRLFTPVIYGNNYTASQNERWKEDDG